MKEDKELPCFNEEPHEGHDWSFYYTSPFRVVHCPGVAEESETRSNNA